VRGEVTTWHATFFGARRLTIEKSWRIRITLESQKLTQKKNVSFSGIGCEFGKCRAKCKIDGGIFSPEQEL